MRKPEFIVPVVTVFNEEGKVDLDGNIRVWNELIDRGVDGILLNGSSGEFFTLSAKERTKLTEEAIAVTKNKVKLIAGTGSNAVAETVRLSSEALELGADAAMVITPYYFGLGHQAIIEYLCNVADQVEGDMMLYNFPDRTGNDIDADVVRQVVSHSPNVVGLKDTVTNMAHTRAIIDAVADLAPDFSVYSGFDENFANNGLVGGNGCIAALANIYPELTHAWTDALSAGDWKRVENIQHVIDKLSKIYNIAPMFVPAIKYAMQCRGFLSQTTCRSTVLPLTKEQKEQVKELLDKVQETVEQQGLL